MKNTDKNTDKIIEKGFVEKNNKRKAGFHKAWSVACVEYVKWICNPRMIIVLVVFIFIYDYIIKEMIKAADKMDSLIMTAEPFIASTNSKLLILFVPAVFLMLISDFPKTDGNTMFFISRTGKLSWILGQILFAVLASLTYLAAICLGSCILVAERAYAGNRWSDVTTKYKIMFPKESGGRAANFITGRLYNNMTPGMAMLRTLTLQFLYLMLIAMMLLTGFAVGKRTLEMIISCSVICLGSGLSLLSGKIKWLFPSANSIAWMHYDMVLKKQIFDIHQSYWYFIVLIFIMFLISVTFIKRYDFSKITDMED